MYRKEAINLSKSMGGIPCVLFELGIFWILIFSMVGIGSAADYYVAKNGNDNNPGNETLPFLTIQKALNTMIAGDTTYVKAGTYNESLMINKAGNASAWITLRNYNNDEVWINGENTTSPNINLGGYSYWRIIGLKGTKAGNASATSDVHGIRIGQYAHDILIQNVVIKEPNGDGIAMLGHNYNISVLDSEIFDMKKYHPDPEGYGHGIRVTIVDGAPNTSDITIRNNFIHDSHGKAGLALVDYSSLDSPYKPQNVTFEYNLVRDCTAGIKVNADGIFRFNLLIDTKKYTSGAEYPYWGFQVFTHDQENNVRNAEIYSNTVVGFDKSYSFEMGDSNPPQTIAVFKNNIGYNPKYYTVIVNKTTFKSEGYNLFYGGSFSNYTPDSTTLQRDPRFVDPTSHNYSLKFNSPCIDAGTVIYAGQPYNGTAPDIGAIESPYTGIVYYASPSGGGDGSQDNPFQIKDFWRYAEPGVTLALKNGTYTGSNSMIINYNLNGIPGKPITIRALYDGQAIIDGQNSLTPVWLEGSNLVIEGIRAQNSSGSLVTLNHGSNNTLRRISAYNAALGNNHIFNLVDQTNTLVEDCIASGTGRNCYLVYDSQYVTLRRCWGMFMHSNETVKDWGQIYGSHHCLVENCIGTMDKSYTGNVGGLADWCAEWNTNASSYNRHIGNVFYGFTSDAYTVNQQNHSEMTGNSFKDCVAIGSHRYGFRQLGDQDLKMEHMTIVDSEMAAVYIRASETVLRNSVLLNGETGIFAENDFSHSYNDIYGFASPYYGTTKGLEELAMDPSFKVEEYGKGAYLFVPKDSPLQGKASDGRATGAEVLYQYENGVLTNKRLWPWPMEDRIFKETGVSVTWESKGGVWKTLDGVYSNGTISGTVKDTSNNPILGATVSANGYFNITNTMGGYTITNIPVGTYTVNASKAGYFSESRENIQILQNQTTTVNFRLIEAPSLGIVSGMVMYACNGTGITDVKVNLTKDQMVIASTTTNSKGNYIIGNISPGTYTLTVSKISFWSNSTSVTVTADQTVTAYMALRLKGDLNTNGIAADEDDLELMRNASVGLITPDSRYDLNGNGVYADAGDYAMLQDAHRGKIVLG